MGHLTRDATETGWAAGGSVLYAAATWRELGARAHIVSLVGEDFDHPIWPGVRAEVARVSGQSTAFCNTYPAQAARVQWVNWAAPPVEPHLAPPQWLAADVVFLAPVLGELDLAAWLDVCDARIVAVGVQGWTKRATLTAARARVYMDRWEPAAELLQRVDVAVLSSEDTAGDPTLVARLCAAVPIVAYTQGARGCSLFVHGERTHIPAHPANERDPTGAGDTFAAGLLYGLAAGFAPCEAARLGAVAASVVVEGPGATPLARLAELVDIRFGSLRPA